MSITYTLAPNPKWYIADLTGKPLGGGTMYTYRSLDKTTLKFVFQDPAGNFPWTDPILFDENGSQGPFYWEFDSSNPQETYYIEVYDAQGVLQWTIDNFTPPSSGGGSIITTAIDFENLITNNVFWRGTIGATPVSGAISLKLAPGSHAAFSNNVNNTAGTYTGPDIYFIKNNILATDALSMPKFTFGTNPLTGDVTPVQYLNYTCSVAGSAETIKCVQYPITTNVQNLSNTAAAVTIWARCNSGNTTLTLQWYQFFGDGVGASTPVVTPIQALTLTSSWQRFTVTTTIPSVATKTLGSSGACANDGLFLQVSYPFNALTNIDFVKPCVYVGSIFPEEEHQVNDTIDSIINAPRTGYITQGYDLLSPPGYVIMNDGTIGSGSSAASTRANSDTFALYNLLYNNVTIPSGNTLCVVTGYTGNAINDYVANKVMQLPVVLGRAMASAGAGSGLTSRTLGSVVGAETHILTKAELPDPLTNTAFGFSASGAGTQVIASSTSYGGSTVSNQGGNQPHTIMQPTSFMNFYIKL